MIAAVAGVPSTALSELPASGSWREIGPPVGQIGGLAVDATDPSVVVASTRTNGVFRSSDGGRSWTRSEPVSFGNRTRTLVADPHQSGAFYALTSFTGRISRSTDGGATWNDVPGTYSGANSSFAVDPINAGVIYVGTSGAGLVQSTNSGRTWARLDESDETFSGVLITSIAVDPLNADRLFVATQSADPGIAEATFDGTNWTFTPRNTGLSNPRSAELAFDAAGALFATVANNTFRYDDATTSWVSTSHPGGVRLITAEPGAGGVLFTGGTDGIHRTATGGGIGAWRLEAHSAFGEILEVAFAERALAGTNGFGILRRNSGVWSTSNAGLNAGEMSGLLVDPATPGRYLGGVFGPGLVETVDGGATWAATGAGLAPDTGVSLLQVSMDDASTYFGFQRDDLYRSTDAGQSWENLDPENAVNRDIRGLVQLDAQTVFVATTGGVYRGDLSDVENVVWTLENEGLTNTSLNGLVRDNATGHLYTISFGRGAHRGVDTEAGLSWIDVPDDGPTNNFGSSIAIDQARGFVYFANTSGALFRLDLAEEGAQFSLLADDLPGSSAVLFAPSGIGQLVASVRDDGLYFSDNDGVNWEPLGDAFPFTVTAFVEDVHQHDQYLAASRGASIARIGPDAVFASGFESVGGR
ncbi:MAG: YCF48-related protein [Pseudomonadota bacterium]